MHDQLTQRAAPPEDQKSHELHPEIQFLCAASKRRRVKAAFLNLCRPGAQHLNTINQIPVGQQPAMGSGQQQQQQGQGSKLNRVRGD